MAEIQVRACAIADALDVIGERWALLVVRELFLDNHRFAGIAARTGAPTDILSARLKRLTAEGLIERRPYSTHPPRDEYHLTERGRALWPVLTAIQQWSLEQIPRDDSRPATMLPGPGPACPDRTTASGRPPASDRPTSPDRPPASDRPSSPD